MSVIIDTQSAVIRWSALLTGDMCIGTWMTFLVVQQQDDDGVMKVARWYNDERGGIERLEWTMFTDRLLFLDGWYMIIRRRDT